MKQVFCILYAVFCILYLSPRGTIPITGEVSFYFQSFSFDNFQSILLCIRRHFDRSIALAFIFPPLKVECLLTLAIWSYGHEAEEYIFLNLPFPSNPKESSSIRCILSTPGQNLL